MDFCEHVCVCVYSGMVECKLNIVRIDCVRMSVMSIERRQMHDAAAIVSQPQLTNRDELLFRVVLALP